MQKKIIRNISTEKRFFEIINSMPEPTMHLYSEGVFGVEAHTLAEATNKNGVCVYRFKSFSNIQEFEKQFKALKKELNA